MRKLKSKRGNAKPQLLAMDLEGCLIPEIWIGLAQATKIDELRLSTRDIENYDTLMQKRISILDAHKISLDDIHKVIETLEPLQGALEFLNWVRSSIIPFIILSDTFYEFAGPLMRKLNYPSLFCHTLEIENGKIKDYHLRCPNSKAQAISNFQNNGFYVSAIGDSFNDIQMLKTADRGMFLNAPSEISNLHPELPSYANYKSLKQGLAHIFNHK